MVKSTHRKPAVSVLLLCWNHAHLLDKCITSLALQTDKYFEIIFLDNVSTDRSFEVAAAAFKRLNLEAKMFRNEKPLGICVNLNKLFAHSTGTLVCPLSTDDWYKPRYIEAVREAANRFPGAAWYYGPRTSGNDNGEEILEAKQHTVSGDILPNFLRGEHPVNMNGSAYRRSAIEKIGGWDEAMCLEDFDLTFRLAQIGECRYIDEPLAVFRSHANNSSKNLDFMIEGARQFFAKHGHHFPRGGRPALSDSIRQMAAREIDLNNKGKAFRLLARSVRTDPFNPRIVRTAVYLGRRMFSSIFRTA